MKLKTKITLLACILPVPSSVYALFSNQISLLLNSLLTLGCLSGFWILDKKLNVFSTKSFVSVLIFILLSVFAGRSFSLYEKFIYWDKFLHFLSGFILVVIAKQVYKKLKGNVHNKALIKLFSLFTAVSGAAFWEIYEFSCDRILGTTAQNNSLTDTMLDIILGTLSALIGIFI